MIDSSNPTGGYSSGGSARSPEYDDGIDAGTAPIGSRDNLASGNAGHSSASGSSHAPSRSSAGAQSQSQSSTSADETADLISADKVHGTAVYGNTGERLGTIDAVMIGKRSGKVAYVVMSFGGFLGIGERYHPLPWNMLSYDEVRGGYSVGHSADALRNAPNYSRDELDRREYGHAVDEYYGGATTTGATRIV